MGATGFLRVALAQDSPGIILNTAADSRVRVSELDRGLGKQKSITQMAIVHCVPEAVSEALQFSSVAICGLHTLARPVLAIIIRRVWSSESAPVRSLR